MASCHGAGSGQVLELSADGTVDDTLRVLLVGGPNVGKSTLFNALTGARQRTMNSPGTTVELATGTWKTPARGIGDPATECAIVDLPGTYSLLARSADEQVTADSVRELAQSFGEQGFGEPGFGERGFGKATRQPGVVVVVLDATALARSLYLVGQVAEMGVPVVVALTMLDLAEGATDSPTAVVKPQMLAATLASALGVPVVPVDARIRSHGGLRDLSEAVHDVAAYPRGVTGIKVAEDPCTCQPSRKPGDGAADSPANLGTVRVDHADPAIHDLAQDLAHAETLFAWVEQVIAQVNGGIAPDHETPSRSKGPVRRTFSDRADSVLLNPWAGIPVFLAVVWLLFELTTKFAAPLQGAIGHVVNGPINSLVTWLLSLVGLGQGLVHGLLVNGLLVGVGTVLTFLPVMAIMFASLSILEDSGYMARAAFVADRAMRSLGLDGRALLPLIIGFGCNLPALAATRTLPKSRQRLLTGLLIPLTSCSARLTVYILLASAFFPQYAGTVIFAMYLTSILLVLGGGLLLRKTAFRDVSAGPLILVLPPYQRPHLRTLAMSVRMRVGAFVMRAGKIIVITMVFVWALMAIPVTGQRSIGNVPVADSLYYSVASGIAPVFRPAGFGNDHAAAALMTGFVAKEVVVGSFAQSYAVAAPTDPAKAGNLGSQLRSSFDESSGGHGGAAALAFMIFVLAYTPCVAALAEQRRLFGWRPAASALAAQLAAAWVLAVLVFQVGSRL